MNNLILIDGNSLINRAYYATPPLSSKDGRPTNAVYAFVNMLVKLIFDVKPEYILVAFDRKEPTFRHKMYADYKGTRKRACILPKEEFRTSKYTITIILLTKQA